MKIDKVVIQPVNYIACLYPRDTSIKTLGVSKKVRSSMAPECTLASGIFFGDDCTKMKEGSDIDKKISAAFYNRDIWAQEWELKIPRFETNEYTKVLNEVIEILYYILSDVNIDNPVNFYFNNNGDNISILSSEYFDRILDMVKKLGKYPFNKIEFVDYTDLNYTDYEMERLREIFLLKDLCTISFTHDSYG